MKIVHRVINCNGKPIENNFFIPYIHMCYLEQEGEMKMASWITHLRIAENLQRKQQFPSYTYLLIGSVAPDSGKLNEDRRSYNPSSKISHFQGEVEKMWRYKDMRYCEDLRYFRSYIKPNITESTADEELCFHYGYFIHLIVDSLWSYFIYRPTKGRFKGMFEKDPLFSWEVKKDWHGLDVEYLQENKGWETWKLFNNSYYDLDCLEFYPQENIQEKLEEIKNNFRVEEGYSRPNKYLQKQELELFIKIVTQLILDVLNNIEKIEIKYSMTVLEYLENKYDFFKSETGNIYKAADEIIFV